MSEKLDNFLKDGSEEARILAIQTAERVGAFTIDYLAGRGWPSSPDNNGTHDLSLDEALVRANELDASLGEKIRVRKEAHDIAVEAFKKAAEIALRLAIGGLA